MQLDQFKLKEARVTIVGLGLMGASLGYELCGYCERVTALVRRAEAAVEAVESGCVDDATLDARAAVADANLVILATPVRTILRQIAELGPLLPAGAVVTDMGSTKVEICQALETLPSYVQVIGGHPMCGKEQAGLQAAESGLYENCTYVLCPTSRTTESTQNLMLELVEHIGARPLILDAPCHDRLVAAISHLPYLVASALVAHVDAVGATDATVWDVASSGFRDTSRVAASSVDMLMDILITNRHAVIDAVDDYQGRLEMLRDLLESGDEVGLRSMLETIAEARRGWRDR